MSNLATTASDATAESAAQPTIQSGAARRAITDDRFALLPRILRGLGAFTLIASVSIFLLQGWENGNDVFRYLLLLGHSVALTVIGFASGHYLKESKGARLLVTLALASVPANFAILGAFIYSLVALGGTELPQFVVWHVGDWTTALTTLTGAVILLAPMVTLGFMVLARSSALRLSGVFLLGNAALLIPARDPVTTALLMLVLTAVALWANARITKTDGSLRTWEGLVARALQFVPVGVVFGRTAWLYSGDAFVFTAMSVIAFLMLRHFSLMMKAKSAVRGLIEKASVVPALTTAYGAVFCSDRLFPMVTGSVLIPLFASVAAALMFEIGMRAASGGAGYRRLAAVFIAAGLLGQLWLGGSVVTATFCLIAGLGLVVYGYTVEQRVVFGLGALVLTVGLIHQIHFAITTFNLGSWGSLAALGVVAILAGSALERHGPRIKVQMASWKNRFRGWEY